MDSELGVTYPRLSELIQLHGRERNRDLHDLGVVTNLAQADPKKLRKLDPSERRSVTNADVPPQLRIPRKRGATHAS